MMEMDSKKKKKLKQQQQLDDDDDETQGVDEYYPCSYLPECIISHILCFLPTEDSVRASFVSKNWKSLLYPLPILDLDFDRFSKNSSLDDQPKRFAQFVEHVMLLHKGGHLVEFRLAFDLTEFQEDDPQVDDWVSFAMTSDSTTLDLDFWGGREGNDYPDDDDEYYCLPEFALRLELVEVLRLKYCSFKTSQGLIYFMSIRILVLTAVSLPDDSVLILIESCPSLQELHLIECLLPQDLIIEDLDTELEYLVFDSCKGSVLWLYTFIIHIPSLLRLKYVGEMTTDFHIENLRNLTEADINFVDEYYELFATKAEASKFCAMIRDLLSNMENLDTLTISKSFLQVLTFEYGKTMEALIAGDRSHEKLPPPLPKLKHLSLISYDGYSFILNFACLLKSSPNLETLCIDQSRDELIDPDLNAYLFDHRLENIWRTYLLPPELFRNLKKVEIKGFEGRSEEILLLKIVLDHSLVLEEMVIYKAAMKSRYASMKRAGNLEKAVKVLKPKQQAVIDKLLSFRRGSSRARILLL